VGIVDEVVAATTGWLDERAADPPWLHVSVCPTPPDWGDGETCFVVVVDPAGRDAATCTRLRSELVVVLSSRMGAVIEVVSVTDEALRTDYGQAELWEIAAADGRLLHGPPLAQLINPSAGRA
jgi:hypothetical protein